MSERFISIAKRRNNTKRGYLIVNPLQAKHVPVSPNVALSVFKDLASMIKGCYEGENLLFVGFAETATAIGAQISIISEMPYIQTTREIIPNVDYLFFSEEHSHATEQKLVKTDLDNIIEKTDRIIFVEDEVSTGTTIFNIISLIQKTYQKKISFSVMSIVNGMTDDDMEKYSDIDIDFIFLEKINRSGFEEIASKFEDDEKYVLNESSSVCSVLVDYKIVSFHGLKNARRLVNSKTYQNACERLATDVIENFGINSNEKILVLGTEEFMFPAIYVGKKIEDMGNVVRTHSTTRSPISVCSDVDYPLRSCFQLKSLYDSKRTTYIYNLDSYDRVFIITDSTLEEKEGVMSLVSAVGKFSSDITVIRWVK